MNTQASIMQFDGEDFEVITVNNRPAMTGETIGKHLKYAEPRKRINELFNRNRDEFENDVDYAVRKLRTPGGEQEMLIFFDTGAILLTMFTEQPEGKRYRKIFKHILAAVGASAAPKPLPPRNKGFREELRYSLECHPESANNMELARQKNIESLQKELAYTVRRLADYNVSVQIPPITSGPAAPPQAPDDKYVALLEQNNRLLEEKLNYLQHKAKLTRINLMSSKIIIRTARDLFHGKKLEFIFVDDKPAFTSRTLGLALEYDDPVNSIRRIFARHERLFKNGIDSDTVKLTATDGKVYDTMIFYWPGVVLLLAKSNQPLADEFLLWAKDILANLIMGVMPQPSPQPPVSAVAPEATMISAANYIAVLEENRRLFQDRVHCLENHQSPYLPAPKANSVSCSIAEQRKLMLARYGMTQKDFALSTGVNYATVVKFIKGKSNNLILAAAFDRLTDGKSAEPPTQMTYTHSDQTQTQMELSISDQRKLAVSRLGLTQRELAKRTGFSHQYINQWLNCGNHSRKISKAIEQLTAEPKPA